MNPLARPIDARSRLILGVAGFRANAANYRYGARDRSGIAREGKSEYGTKWVERSER